MKKRIAELEMGNEIIKSHHHIRKKTIKVIVTFIDKYKSIYTAKLICKALHFPKSTYYKALTRVPTNCQVAADRLKAEIKKYGWKAKLAMELLKSIRFCLVKGGSQFKTYLALHERYENQIHCCKEVSLLFRKNRF